MAQIDTTYGITVRFFDLDINNHVNNAVYFTYMEEARTHLLLDQFLDCKRNGIDFVVVEATCRYKKPITGLQETVVVKIDVENIKAVSFDLVYTFLDQTGGVYAIGRTLMACVDSASHKAVRIPKDILEFLPQIDRKTN